MVWCLANNHNVISYYYVLLHVSRTLVKLAPKDICCHCHTKWHYCISKPSKLCIEGSKKGWSLIKLLVSIPLLAITHRHDACIHKQMSYVLRCLEMIWFPHYCFIKIGGTQADSKLQVTSLVFPSTNTKLLIHGVASCTGFRIRTFNILSISCLKASFKCIGISLQGVCLGAMLGSTCIW